MRRPSVRQGRLQVTKIIGLLTLSAGLLAGLSGNTAIAATPEQRAIPAADGTCPNPGKATPILFVHGMDSKPSDFTNRGTPNLASALSTLPDVAASYFSYGAYSLDWVTDPHIGPALAKEIVCLSDTSSANGGPGKVIVVTHSMGGLALRDAATQTVAGRSVADRIGLAVTIAAPNTGSWLDAFVGPGARTVKGVVTGGSPVTTFLANQIEGVARWACSSHSQTPSFLAGTVELCGLILSPDSPAGQAMIPGSKQLAALPLLPTSIPLYAVAGDIELTTTLFNQTTDLGDIGDLLVKPDSALAEDNRSVPFSGHFIDGCSESITDFVTLKVGWEGCEHGGLLYDPPVIAKVRTEVLSYLASLQPHVIDIDDSGQPLTPSALSIAQRILNAAETHNESALNQLAISTAAADSTAVAALDQLLSQPGAYDQIVKLLTMTHGAPTDGESWPGFTLADGQGMFDQHDEAVLGISDPSAYTGLRVIIGCGLGGLPTNAPPAASSGCGFSGIQPAAPPPLPTVDINEGNFTPEVRPSTIGISNDATNIVTGLTWTGWDQHGATGHGTVDILSCVPDCASGTSTPTPVTIYLNDPINGVFSVLTEDIAGVSQNYTLPTS